MSRDELARRAGRVLAWIKGGCSSWGTPADDIRALALAALEGDAQPVAEDRRRAIAKFLRETAKGRLQTREGESVDDPMMIEAADLLAAAPPPPKLGVAVEALRPFAELIEASDALAAAGQRRLQPDDAEGMTDAELAALVDPDDTVKITDGRMAFGYKGELGETRKVTTRDFRRAREALSQLEKPGE